MVKIIHIEAICLSPPARGTPSAATAPRCRLLELPAELRNTIFSSALTSPQPVKINNLHCFDYGPGGAGEMLYFGVPLHPLLKVSHQVMAETTDVYFGSNTFHLTIPPDSPQAHGKFGSARFRRARSQSSSHQTLRDPGVKPPVHRRHQQRARLQICEIRAGLQVSDYVRSWRFANQGSTMSNARRLCSDQGNNSCSCSWWKIWVGVGRNGCDDRVLVVRVLRREGRDNDVRRID